MHEVDQIFVLCDKLYQNIYTQCWILHRIPKFISSAVPSKQHYQSQPERYYSPREAKCAKVTENVAWLPVISILPKKGRVSLPQVGVWQSNRATSSELEIHLKWAIFVKSLVGCLLTWGRLWARHASRWSKFLSLFAWSWAPFRFISNWGKGWKSGFTWPLLYLKHPL